MTTSPKFVPDDLMALLALVTRMRDDQRAYFKLRTPEALHASKRSVR